MCREGKAGGESKGDEEQTTRKPRCGADGERGQHQGARKTLRGSRRFYAAVVAPATGPDDALLLSSMLWKSRISEYIICEHANDQYTADGRQLRASTYHFPRVDRQVGIVERPVERFRRDRLVGRVVIGLEVSCGGEKGEFCKHIKKRRGVVDQP